MTVKRRPYKTYPKEFKLEALRLMECSGHQPALVKTLVVRAIPL